MRYKIQIGGWLLSGVISLWCGYLENNAGYGDRFIYLGLLAILISFLTYYITNKTDMVEKLIARSEHNVKIGKTKK